MAQTKISWSDPYGQANVYAVTCSLEREEGGQLFHEEISTTTTKCCVMMTGLRPKTEYLATVTVLEDGDQRFAVTAQRMGKIKFKTGHRFKNSPFAWDTADCKETVALSACKTKVTLKQFEAEVLQDLCPDMNPSWTRVDGISSDFLFSEGTHSWEMLIDFHVLGELDKFDLVASLGVCRQGHEEDTNRLSWNRCFLGMCLMQVPGKGNIVLRSHDGRETKDKRMGRYLVVFSGDPGTESSVRIGFYLDLKHRRMNVVNCDRNKILHTFTDIKWKYVSVVCEMQSPEKVRSSIELLTADFTDLPSVLFD